MGNYPQHAFSPPSTHPLALTFSFRPGALADRQAGSQSDRQAGLQTGRHARKQAGRQTGRQTGRQAGRQALRWQVAGGQGCLCSGLAGLLVRAVWVASAAWLAGMVAEWHGGRVAAWGRAIGFDKWGICFAICRRCLRHLGEFCCHPCFRQPWRV